MSVDFYATETHYLEHLVPIWRAMPAEQRGTFYCGGHVKALAASVDGFRGVPRGSGITAVASSKDLRVARERGPVIFVEHGAGQTYVSDGPVNPSYSGGEGREGVVLFICPNYEVAGRNAQAYPGVHSVAVGSPKLAEWHRRKAQGGLEAYDPDTVSGKRPTVAVSFHWDCRLVPEARWAFPHYRRMLERSKLQATEFEVIGHGHPRAWRRLKPFWESIGVEPVASFDEVLERADVYVCDNSSTLFEFAAIKGRVVLLNAPWYRRDVHHGLRFWDAAGIGVQCDNPENIIPSIVTSLGMSSAEVAGITEPHLRRIYHVRDGTAASRGAHSIADLVLAKGRIDDGQPQVSPR